MPLPNAGAPQLAGDLLFRYLPPGWGVPTGWTLLGNQNGADVIWRYADQSGAGDPDVHVVTPAEAERITRQVMAGDERPGFDPDWLI
jgi:hypothetical protein